MADSSGALQSLWLPSLVGLVAGALLAGGFAGWRRAGTREAGTVPTPHSALPALRPLISGQLDVESELRAAAADASNALAKQHDVRLEVAIQPGLTLRADAVALRRIVSDLLANAIGHSEGGRVLLSAGRHGGRVRIAVLDDGALVDRAEQEAHLRDAERLVALQGGTLDVTVRAGAGTTVAVRLPEPQADATPRAAQPATRAAQADIAPAPARGEAPARAG